MRLVLGLALLVAGCTDGSSASTSNVEFTLLQTVDKGSEVTRCKLVSMPAGERYVIGASHMYTPGSHHMLLYRTDLAAIPAGMDGVMGCYEDGGALMSHVRGVLYGSTVPQGKFTLPEGVAFQMASEEVLLLQAHYVNATQGSLDARVTVDLVTTVDKSRVRDHAGTLFYYDPFIDVPPHATATASGRCTLSSDIHLVSIFPHYHSRGVGYRAYLDLPGQPAAADPFYVSTDYNHPAEFTGGPLTISAGTALRWYCDYDNVMGTAEYFQGQSATDNEMCMFTGMYYPAMSTVEEECRHSMDMFGTGTTTCADTLTCVQSCPTAGAPRGLGVAGADVAPCWQKCITASCPSASTPLLAMLLCAGKNCATECAPGGDCRGCVVAKCGAQALACQTAACN
jgi:hypothetical protein